MYLIYNAGYRSTLTIKGKYSQKWFVFKKRFVTEVSKEDGEAFLKMTSKEIQWCPEDPKNLPPFMTVEDWCSGKEGRVDSRPYKIYESEKYTRLFLLK
jgi:hypothetical protein